LPATLELTPADLKVANNVQVGTADVPPGVAVMLATYLPELTALDGTWQVTD